MRRHFAPQRGASWFVVRSDSDESFSRMSLLGSAMRDVSCCFPLPFLPPAAFLLHSQSEAEASDSQFRSSSSFAPVAVSRRARRSPSSAVHACRRLRFDWVGPRRKFPLRTRLSRRARQSRTAPFPLPDEAPRLGVFCDANSCCFLFWRHSIRRDNTCCTNYNNDIACCGAAGVRRRSPARSGHRHSLRRR